MSLAQNKNMKKTKTKKLLKSVARKFKSLGGAKKKRTFSSFGLAASRYSFKLPKATCKKCSGFLLNLRPVVNCCQQYQRSLMYGLLGISLIIVLAGFNSSAPTTFYEANNQLIGNYTSFIAQSYSSMVKDTILAWGEFVYPITQTNVVLMDTVQAYSAMFQVAAKPMSEFFAGTGQLIAALSFAAVHSEQVLAMAMP